MDINWKSEESAWNERWSKKKWEKNQMISGNEKCFSSKNSMLNERRSEKMLKVTKNERKSEETVLKKMEKERKISKVMNKTWQKLKKSKYIKSSPSIDFSKQNHKKQLEKKLNNDLECYTGIDVSIAIIMCVCCINRVVC